MNLGEALSLLKKEKSRLSRLIDLRKEHLYKEEGKKATFNPKKLSDEINKKTDYIRMLKIRIQKTNLHTLVKGETLSLAEAIIKVNDIRKKIANLTTLFEERRSYFSDSKDKKKVAQLDELKIEDEIMTLEREKVQLDNKIKMTNWVTLVE